MYSKETASGISKLMNIVEQVKDKLKSSGFQVSNLNAYNYGYYFSSLVYFGKRWQFWAEHNFPLCIAISKDHERNQSLQVVFRDHYKNRVLPFEDDGEYLVVGYKLPESCTDCSELIEEIFRDIEALLRKDNSESSEGVETP